MLRQKILWNWKSWAPPKYVGQFRSNLRGQKVKKHKVTWNCAIFCGFFAEKIEHTLKLESPFNISQSFENPRCRSSNLVCSCFNSSQSLSYAAWPSCSHSWTSRRWPRNQWRRLPARNAFCYFFALYEVNLLGQGPNFSSCSEFKTVIMNFRVHMATWNFHGTFWVQWATNHSKKVFVLRYSILVEAACPDTSRFTV